MQTKCILRSFILLCTSLLLSWTSVGTCSDLALHGDRISLHVRNIHLQTILREFTQLGIAVQIAPSINPLVTVSFDNRELQQGLKSIIHPYSYALLWKPGNKTTGAKTSLAELQVFARGKRSAMQYLTTPKTAPCVKGEILIKLSGHITAARLNHIAQSVHGTIAGGNGALGIFKIRVAQNGDIQALTAQIINSGLAQAEPNYIFHLSPPVQLPEKTGQNTDDNTNNNRLSLGNVAVAVLDSGLFSGFGLEEYVSASYDPLHPNQPISDSMGHGTQMAMIATGMIQPDGNSPSDGEATPVIPIKIFDDQGLTSNYTLLQSISFAQTHGGRVLSLSWETETDSAFLRQTLNNAIADGTIIFAAAGNHPTGTPVYPAAYDSVIGVGALSADGTQWENSNYGDFVDLFAPGIATFPVGNQGAAGTYAGTSISTAYVAGLAARYLSQHPGAKQKDIETFLGMSKKD